PESARGSTVNGLASGASLPDSLASYDRASSSWRTSQFSLFGGCSEFSETLPRSGMTRSGIAYQLPPLAPLTAEIDSGLLPTLTVVACEHPGRVKRKAHQQVC